MIRSLLLTVVLTAPSWSQPRLPDLIASHFNQWDRNGDAVLSPAEIDQLMADPTIQGDEAAAVATMRWAQGKMQLAINPTNLDRLPGRRYRSYRNRLEKANLELFPAGQPSQLNIRQDRGGECYFLCVVGAMLERDPRAIRNLILSNREGYLVQFPGQASIQVPPPTPCEIAFFDKDLDGGLWLLVLEKGFAALQNRDRGLRTDMDAINSGGSIGSAMIALTTHRSRGLHLKRTPLNEIRNQLEEAFRRQALVAVASGKGTDQNRPQGVPYGHCWAVLGYDRSSDLVRLWNPWGHEQSTGYLTHHGVLQVPLPEFAQYWNQVVIEKD